MAAALPPSHRHPTATATARSPFCAAPLGVDHIDTSQYYGPDVVNALIREALYPYPDGLRLVTKVGARGDDKGAWLPRCAPTSCVPASRKTFVRSTSSS